MPDFTCPACGLMIEWCLGHPLWGDTGGWLTLKLHRHDVHSRCVPTVCVPEEVA
jgi:hypothetical protein